MSTSLMDKQTPEDVAKLAKDLLDKLVTKVVSIGHGGNSRVFQVTAGEDYVIKFYFQHPADKRDRLGTEFKSLVFLWDKGIRHIPQPISSWPQQSCAVYTMVEGFLVQEITDKDIDSAVDFLKTLKGFNVVASSQSFSAASEAYFSAKEIIASIKIRLQRFGFHDTSVEHQQLKKYLEKDFAPLLSEIEGWSKKFLAESGIAWDSLLPQQYRTLSPSDFGFHNALRQRDGTIVFLDFEYFGWDDPAKTVSDFLWHPAMNLSPELRTQYVRRMRAVFGEDPQFEVRLRSFHPLFGLKWCLIILNEFVKSDLNRRQFAADVQDTVVLQQRQLKKAQDLLLQIKGSYKNFPYDN